MKEEDRRRVPNVGGFYHDGPPPEVVIEKCTEESMVGIMSHEYTHSWQFQKDDNFHHESLRDPSIVPYDGKLILEGFAMWVEFKVLDFYGLAQSMQQIKAFSKDEYRDGFHALEQVEDALGFAGVFRFVKEGASAYEGGLEQLFIDTGLPLAMASGTPSQEISA